MNRNQLLTWHAKLYTAARLHGEVGQTLQLTVPLRVHSKEFQRAFGIEEALATVDGIVGKFG